MMALRRGVLLCVAALMASGVAAGLARAGVAPADIARLDHGALMIAGVFGTVIALERAVALGRPWGYGAPMLGVAAAVGVLAGRGLAPWLAGLSALLLVAMNASLLRFHRALHAWVMLLGAVCLLGAAVVWGLDGRSERALLLWEAFLVLTIAAERMEMSQLVPVPGGAVGAAAVLTGALAVAAGAAPFLGSQSTASQAFGVSAALLGGWMLRFDAARRTFRIGRGLVRFTAAGVLTGAVWLAVHGTMMALWGLPVGGLMRDAQLHTLLVGFVLSMVLAHAPIILPAVAAVRVPFHPGMFVALSLLHVGVTLRVGSALLAFAPLRSVGVLFNALALLTMIFSVLAARKTARGSPMAARTPPGHAPANSNNGFIG